MPTREDTNNEEARQRGRDHHQARVKNASGDVFVGIPTTTDDDDWWTR